MEESLAWGLLVVLTRLFCADVFSISKTKIAIVTIFLIQVFVSRGGAAAQQQENLEACRDAATPRETYYSDS